MRTLPPKIILHTIIMINKCVSTCVYYFMYLFIYFICILISSLSNHFHISNVHVQPHPSHPPIHKRYIFCQRSFCCQYQCVLQKKPKKTWTYISLLLLHIKGLTPQQAFFPDKGLKTACNIAKSDDQLGQNSFRDGIFLLMFKCFVLPPDLFTVAQWTRCCTYIITTVI